MTGDVELIAIAISGISMIVSVISFLNNRNKQIADSVTQTKDTLTKSIDDIKEHLTVAIDAVKDDLHHHTVDDAKIQKELELRIHSHKAILEHIKDFPIRLGILEERLRK